MGSWQAYDWHIFALPVHQLEYALDGIPERGKWEAIWTHCPKQSIKVHGSSWIFFSNSVLVVNAWDELAESESVTTSDQ